MRTCAAAYPNVCFLILQFFHLTMAVIFLHVQLQTDGSVQALDVLLLNTLPRKDIEDITFAH